MSDRLFFHPVDEASPFRQGDIIRQDINSEQRDLPRREWGVIITADCDIAQKKMGEFFTYVSIVPARTYLEQIWAAEELGKFAEKHGRLAIEAVHVADRKRDPAVTPLQHVELLDWIHEDGVNTVLSAVGCNNADARARAYQHLSIFALTDERHGNFDHPLARLKDCWTLLGRSNAERKTQLESALSAKQMRSEYVFVPTLPGETEIGFVVMLREIRSIRQTELFPGKLHLRINNGGSQCMYRVGRFNDNIRYSIAQRLANLFSRIGMTSQFEVECGQAAGLVSDTLA